jgi:hypothetical protein
MSPTELNFSPGDYITQEMSFQRPNFLLFFLLEEHVQGRPGIMTHILLSCPPSQIKSWFPIEQMERDEFVYGLE